ncbi:hypothetical protein R1flu_000359 [Riccia fluitans]|uniref:Uncharacterized protein n=1 Tax=Riccia fluitans TaxID=41844 RepID=A0ABD1Y163_9MARC
MWETSPEEAEIQGAKVSKFLFSDEVIQHQRAVSDVTKFELEYEKQKFEVEKSELRELRGLWRTFEAERLELSGLQQLKGDYEAAIHAADYKLATKETQLKAAEKELQSLGTKRETYHAAAEELVQLRQLKARCESAIHAVSNLRKQRGFLESAAADLAANRKLFFKEARSDCLIAKLRAKELTLEYEVGRTAKYYTAEEVETLREANRASMETETRLREELSAIRKQLVANASKDVRHICFTNARDALQLPCSTFNTVSNA